MSPGSATWCAASQMWDGVYRKYASVSRADDFRMLEAKVYAFVMRCCSSECEKPVAGAGRPERLGMWCIAFAMSSGVRGGALVSVSLLPSVCVDM